jgi:hypothetical protein
MLSVTYKTAWFLSHRIREMMSDTQRGPIGGDGKTVEADEAYFGKRETPVPSEQRKGRPYLKKDLSKQKRPIVALVERGGEARAFHMRHVTGKNIRDALVPAPTARAACIPTRAACIRRSARSLPSTKPCCTPPANTPAARVTIW